MADLYDRISAGTMSVDEITESMVYATSEGGKFFQSMEKQSQTLSGQLSTLADNANELLGSLMSGMSDELSGSILPAVNEMIGNLQAAFDSRGMEGLINTATNMIPDLLDMMTQKLDSAVNALVKWAPKAASALMQAVPGALKAASGAIPKITSALFEVASTVLSDLIGMLPELIPTLIEGAFNSIGSLISGSAKMVSGLFSGIEKMFHQNQTKILGMWVDDSKVVGYNFDIDVTSTVTNNTDAEQIRADVQAAADSIEEALDGVEGIDPASVANAIISGDTTSTLSAAFQQYGLDKESAETIALEITQGQKSINDAIEGLGLSEEAEAQLSAMIGDENTTGDDITAFLEDCGVDTETATAAANSIISGRDQINSAIAGLPPSINAQLMQSGFMMGGSTRSLLETSLRMMGVDQATIDEILGTYDTFSSSLTGKITGIFDDIKQTLTDGVPDDPEKMSALKEQVQAWAKSAHDKIAEWYEEEVENLDTSDSDYATKIAELQARRDALDQSVNQSVDSVTAWIDEMGGETTEYVAEHLDELRALANEAGILASEIDALGGKMTTEAELDYNLVRAGGQATEEEVSMAVKFVVNEYALDEQSAQDAYTAARNDLKAKLDSGEITTEEFEAQDAELQAQRDAAIEAARALYEQRMAELLQGLMQSAGYEKNQQTGAEMREKASEIETNIDTSGYLDSIRDEVEKYVLDNGLAKEVTDEDIRTWALYYAQQLREQAGQVENGTDLSGVLSLYNSMDESGYLSGTSFEGLPDVDALIKAIYGDPNAGGAENPVVDDFEQLERAVADRNEADAEQWNAAVMLEETLENFLPEEGGVNYDAISDEVWAMIAESLGYDESAAEGLKENLSAENVRDALQNLIDKKYEEAEIAAKEALQGLTEEQIAEAEGKEETAFMLQDVLDDYFNVDTGEIDTSAITDEVWAMIADALGYDESQIDALKESLPADTIIQTLEGLIDENMAAADEAFRSGYGGMYSSASYTAQGALDAFGDKDSEFYARGASNARQYKKGYDETLQIQSPSKKMRESGEFTGEGLTQGLNLSMRRAVAVAKSIGGEIVTAADLSQSMRVNVPDLAQEITIANEQTTAPVTLDGKQIATIQGANNRRQLAFERARIARGFGY